MVQRVGCFEDPLPLYPICGIRARLLLQGSELSACGCEFPLGCPDLSLQQAPPYCGPTSSKDAGPCGQCPSLDRDVKTTDSCVGGPQRLYAPPCSLKDALLSVLGDFELACPISAVADNSDGIADKDVNYGPANMTHTAKLEFFFGDSCSDGHMCFAVVLLEGTLAHAAPYNGAVRPSFGSLGGLCSCSPMCPDIPFPPECLK